MSKMSSSGSENKLFHLSCHSLPERLIHQFPPQEDAHLPSVDDRGIWCGSLT